MAIYRTGSGQYQSRGKTYAKRAMLSGGLLGAGFALGNRRVRRHIGLAIRQPLRFSKSAFRMGRRFVRTLR